MSHSKVYPKKQIIRRQSKLACTAIHDLADLGLQVLTVNFIKNAPPTIEISHCSANKKIRSHFTGQGVNNKGNKYVTKSSIFCGCHIFWTEVKNG